MRAINQQDQEIRDESTSSSPSPEMEISGVVHGEADVGKLESQGGNPFIDVRKRFKHYVHKQVLFSHGRIGTKMFTHKCVLLISHYKIIPNINKANYLKESTKQ